MFLHPRYHPKIIGDIFKNIQKTCVCFDDFIAELLNRAWFIYKQNRQLKTAVAMNLIPT